MQAKIIPYSPQDEFFIDEGCYIVELSNSSEDVNVSTAQPGVTTRWHRLIDTIERYAIISGTGLVEAGELAPIVVNLGDVVLIPALCQQRISHSGKQNLVFRAICTPRFSNSCYEDIVAQIE